MAIQVRSYWRGNGDAAGDGGWQPDPAWTRMPPMPREGEQKIQMIVGVSEAYPYFAVQASTAGGQYRVDWGDGAVTTHGSGTVAEHTYDMAAVTSQTTGAGCKTALVTLTPVTLENLRTLSVCRAHSADTRTTASKSSALYYVRGRAGGMTSIAFGTAGTASVWRNALLECVDLMDTASLTTCAYMFANCLSLRSVPQLNTANAASFDHMFDACYSLRHIPCLDTGNGKDIRKMFSSCMCLQSVPCLNMREATLYSGMFSTCYSLTRLRLTMGPGVVSLALSDMPMPRDAIAELFGCLYDRTGLTAGSVVLTRVLGAGSLTEDDKRIAADKTWTVTIQ